MENSKRSDPGEPASEAKEDVGYRKPPRETRFRPGKSANPVLGRAEPRAAPKRKIPKRSSRLSGGHCGSRTHLLGRDEPDGRCAWSPSITKSIIWSKVGIGLY